MRGNWTERIDRAVDAHYESMVRIRRHLHENPELSGQETRTTRYLGDAMEDAGFEVRAAPDGCGLMVDGGTGDASSQGGRGRIIIRADIDALPMEDRKPVDYRSRVSGVTHACGHDSHAATVAGAAWALAQAERAGDLPWPVAWRAVFQPAEEINKGAQQMIEAGALKGVDAALGLHMDPSRPAGRIGVRNGYFTADCDGIEVQIHGQGGHAARPHETLDPIAAGVQLINTLYALVPRHANIHEPVVVTFAQFRGGNSYNVVPDHVELRGTIRSLGADVRQRAKTRIQSVAHGIAQATNLEIDLTFRDGPPSVCNDPSVTDLIRHCAGELIGNQHVEEIDKPSMGGEDFAHYLAHVPGSMFRLGCATRPDAPPLHSPMFDIDERSMSIGAKVLARTVVAWFDPSRPRVDAEKEPLPV